MSMLFFVSIFCNRPHPVKGYYDFMIFRAVCCIAGILPACKPKRCRLEVGDTILLPRPRCGFGLSVMVSGGYALLHYRLLYFGTLCLFKICACAGMIHRIADGRLRTVLAG